MFPMGFFHNNTCRSGIAHGYSDPAIHPGPSATPRSKCIASSGMLQHKIPLEWSDESVRKYRCSVDFLPWFSSVQFPRWLGTTHTHGTRLSRSILCLGRSTRAAKEFAVPQTVAILCHLVYQPPSAHFSDHIA